MYYFASVSLHVAGTAYQQFPDEFELARQCGQDNLSTNKNRRRILVRTLPIFSGAICRDFCFIGIYKIEYGNGFETGAQSVVGMGVPRISSTVRAICPRCCVPKSQASTHQPPQRFNRNKQRKSCCVRLKPFFKHIVRRHIAIAVPKKIGASEINPFGQYFALRLVPSPDVYFLGQHTHGIEQSQKMVQFLTVHGKPRHLCHHLYNEMEKPYMQTSELKAGQIQFDLEYMSEV